MLQYIGIRKWTGRKEIQSATNQIPYGIVREIKTRINIRFKTIALDI